MVRERCVQAWAGKLRWSLCWYLRSTYATELFELDVVMACGRRACVVCSGASLRNLIAGRPRPFRGTDHAIDYDYMPTAEITMYNVFVRHHVYISYHHTVPTNHQLLHKEL